MAKEIKLPQLGQTMEEGTIVNCLVKIGQKVKKGDYLIRNRNRQGYTRDGIARRRFRQGNPR